jgi:hypothetical protein
MSFAQRDAMRRNAALTAMNISVYHTLLLLEGYNTLSGHEGDKQHVKTFLNAEQVMRGACQCRGLREVRV